MAQEQGVGFGKVVLYVVLGVLALVIGFKVLGWIIGGLAWLIVAGAVVAGVGYVAFRAGQRSVRGGTTRRQLPR